MRKYFCYLLKKNLLPMCCFSLLCIIAYVVPVSTASFESWNNPGAYYSGPNPYVNLRLGNIVGVLCVMSVIVPVFMFSYRMNRRSVDMHFSLPLGRTKIAAAHYLVGLVIMLVAYSVAYLWGAIVTVVRVERLYAVWFLWLYLAEIVPALVVYTVTAFMFTRANTVVDGIISVAGALLLPMLVVFAIGEAGALYSVIPGGPNEVAFQPFNIPSLVADAFETAIKRGAPPKWFDPAVPYRGVSDGCDLGGGIMWTLAAVAAAVVLFTRDKYAKAENVGQISESPLCYKVQLPILTAALTAIAALDDLDPTLLLGVAFAAFVGAIVYRRTIKIGKRTAIILIAAVLAGLVIGLISQYAIRPAVINNVFFS